MPAAFDEPFEAERGAHQFNSSMDAALPVTEANQAWARLRAAVMNLSELRRMLNARSGGGMNFDLIREIGLAERRVAEARFELNRLTERACR